MNDISFTKMHGLGNDFVIIHHHADFQLSSAKIKQLANRHIGIGFDQLLLVKKIDHHTLACQIFNADGSEAEQCGNGLRCVAWWAIQEKLISSYQCTIETIAGRFPVNIKNENEITLTIPLSDVKQQQVIRLSHTDYSAMHIIQLGNPHAIIRVEKLNPTIVEKDAQVLSQQHFPHGINMGFMRVLSTEHIQLITIERGSGKTYACGSNACAAALVGMENGWLTSPVRVEFELGSLYVAREQQALHLTGPATMVFKGTLC